MCVFIAKSFSDILQLSSLYALQTCLSFYISSTYRVKFIRVWEFLLVSVAPVRRDHDSMTSRNCVPLYWIGTKL